MSFLKTQHLSFAILLTFTLYSPVEAEEISLEVTAQGTSQTRDLLVDTAKLQGLSRKKSMELLGQPKRSDELFPYTNHRVLVDYYNLEGHSEHLRIFYDQSDIVSAAKVEVAPTAVPRFLGDKVNSVNLSEIKLRDFLNGMPENELRKMSADQISKRLGKPDRSWHVTSRAGGRDWHFLNCLYYLSENGRRAFIVMFNESSNSIYEYRVQSISE